jgi:alpha-glucoside transport system permease protein
MDAPDGRPVRELVPSEERHRHQGWWTALTTPSEFTLQNYEQVITTQGMGQSFMNSLTIAFPATFFTVIVAALAAYAFSWMEFPGATGSSSSSSASRGSDPADADPGAQDVRRAGMTGTFPAVWLAHIAYGLPFAVFLLRNFFVALPKNCSNPRFSKGARTCGCSSGSSCRSPFPRSQLSAIFQFLWLWNDLLVALVYLGGFRSGGAHDRDHLESGQLLR